MALFTTPHQGDVTPKILVRKALTFRVESRPLLHVLNGCIPTTAAWTPLTSLYLAGGHFKSMAIGTPPLELHCVAEVGRRMARPSRMQGSQGMHISYGLLHCHRHSRVGSLFSGSALEVVFDKVQPEVPV